MININAGYNQELLEQCEPLKGYAELIHLIRLEQAKGKSILEAAEIDGASGSRIFLSIELPAAASMLHTTIFIALKDAVLISAPVMVLTGGGPFRSTETVMYYYYLEAFRSGNRAVGTTIATLMVLSSAVIMSLVMRRRRNG